MLTPVSHISFLQQMALSGPAARRLLVACALGGAIGLEREWHHKDSGLRTNMLICMGAALFTIMSVILAGDSTPNKGQVAANIVQGVGFLGAGLILHTKSRVLGLTTAATVFVVAAIGMACGDGMYMAALIATVLLLAALQIIGAMEAKLGWKRYPMVYEVRAEVGSVMGKDVVGAERAEELAKQVTAARFRMMSAIIKVLDAVGQRLQVIDRDNVAGWERVSFTLNATKRKHAQVLAELKANDATDHVVVFDDAEVE
ncbi:MAG TPA: MgtC/SapB family protein [Acidobacteriaceae bacterium]|nr:MgtC/SapB family protein [Acidobacteriaceae bacterium]